MIIVGSRTTSTSVPQGVRETITHHVLSACGFIIFAISLIPSAAHAPDYVIDLDAWLNIHSTVSDAMVWEFPPSQDKRRIPYIPRKPIRWSAPGIGPDPILIAPLTQSVFPALDLETQRILSSDGENDALGVPSQQLFVDAAPNSVGAFPDKLFPGKLHERIPGGIKKSEYGAEIRSWSKWPDWARDELNAQVVTYRSWTQSACQLYSAYAATEFTEKPPGFDNWFSSIVDLDPMPVTDPPLNIQPDDPTVDGVPWAMVSSHDAFALYVRLVAAQLAIELTDCVPWSLLDYATSDLAPLFDGRRIFRYVPAGNSEWGTMTESGHIISTTVTPAPPLIVLGFLAENGLIGSDRTETIVRLLDWERNHLRHVIGGGTTNPLLGAGILYWGYNGRAPVSRMISGTIMAGPLYGSNNSIYYYDPELRHWVGGCGGASGFNEQVFRVVNIAAEQTNYSHFQNRFSLAQGVHVAIAHADDPYGIASAPEIPMHEILIDDATFHAWFVNETDSTEQLKNISRQTADLYLQYLPHVLLKLHCYDILYYFNNHASSNVYDHAFMATYSVAEMETMGLWTGIEDKLIELGGTVLDGCAALGYY